MDVTLKPELQRFIDEQVEAGRFATPAEVLEAALLRLMRDPADDELDAADIADIEQSEQEIARGEDMDWDQVSARLRQKYLAE
jgi:putative addiction module CopG family antidote